MENEKKQTLVEQAREKRPDLGIEHVKDLIAVDKVLSGNKNAFDVLYNKYYTYMLQYSMQRTGFNEELSKDLAMEILTKVYINLDKFKFESSTLSAWITSIASNHIINYFNDIHPKHISSIKVIGKNVDEDNELAFQIEDEEVLPDDKLSSKDRVEIIMKLINKMKKNKKMALELIDVQDKSYDEAALEMGISLTNLKVTLMRARKELQVMLIDAGIVMNGFKGEKLKGGIES